MHKIDIWDGCYPSSWNGKIVKEAMSHPAKFSSRLIGKIYDHIMDEKWATAGDSVIDPFGGVGLGAPEAMRLGLNWQGVELEPKFHKIGEQNIKLWMRKMGRLPRWGTAHLHCGDSRKLLDVLNGQVSVAVSSPPYENTDLGGGAGILARDEAMRKTHGMLLEDVNYGETPGQLGTMSATGFEIAISSPPFLQSEGGSPEPKPGGAIDHALYARHAAGNKSSDAYGTTEGQLSSMKEGGFDVAVSSPPYEESRVESDMQRRVHDKNVKMGSMDSGVREYGETEGQLSNSDDFWLASRAIVEQVYMALTPGGHAVWVVKNYVKNKKIVPFTDQWRQLCEAVGFTTLHEHHASLIRNVRSQHTLEGGIETRQSESKSFFRRLAEKKGSPRIDYETVLCMVK